MPLTLDLLAVDRVTALKTWLTYHRISQVELGRRLGVSSSRVDKIFHGQYPRPEQLQALRELGVPEELLPAPGARRVGRPSAVDGSYELVVETLREMGGAADTQLALLDRLKAKGLKLTTAQGVVRRAVRDGAILEEPLPKGRKRYRLAEGAIGDQDTIWQKSYAKPRSVAPGSSTAGGDSRLPPLTGLPKRNLPSG